jgi:hypothetical protein
MGRYCSRMSVRRIAIGILVAGVCGSAWGEPETYLRVLEDDDGVVQRLQVAARTFRREGAPPVELVGAIHIADAEYYRRVQEILDGHGVVLFEAVRPPGAGDGSPIPDDMDDATRARMTEQRLRFVGSAVEAYRRAHGTGPACADELLEGVPGKLRPMLARSLSDFWGRPLVLEFDGTGGVEVMSLGSDGVPGGEGPAADLRLSAQEPLTPAERGERVNLQQRMARALGLTFQLDAIDYARPNWRNSDMSMDQIRQAVGDDAQALALFSMLDGGSFPARMASMVLGMIEGNPRLAAGMKLMLLVTLENADAALSQTGPEMGRLMRVILEDRNGVVMRDLARVLEREAGVSSVAVFYGAGHMQGLESRLTSELGYEPVTTRWVDAIRVDLRDSGMTPEQGRVMQEAFRRMMERRAGGGVNP